MITTDTLKDVCGNFTLDVAGSMSPDKDSTDSKSFVLRFHFEGVALKDVFAKAIAGAKIQWVNGVGRKGYDKIKSGSVIDVNFASPGAKIETREDKIAKLVGMGLPQELAELAVDNPAAVAEAWGTLKSE